MPGETYKVPVETLKRFMKDVFLKLGVSQEDATICSEVLIAADLRGIDSHGIGRLKMYYDRIKDGVQLPKTDFKISQETPTTAVIDGEHGMGQVIAYKSMKLAIKKAREQGLGAVAVRDSSHFGIAGYYARMAMQENMIGLTLTNARPSIVPTFGAEPMFGTNPIAFGAPTDEECGFLFDGATSITQRGKIEVLERAEKPTPEGWAIDQDGNPYTDTKKLLKDLVEAKASLLPLGGSSELLGGHKGYGLAMVVEILCAALQGGNYLKGLSGFKEGKKGFHNLGHFFLVINIANFTPLERFKKIAGDILRQLRNSKKLPREKRIYVAGEKECALEKIRSKKGVPINPNLQKNIKIMQNELGLTQYKFPF